MYLLYRKSQERDATRFEKVENTHLFGCNQGYIPRFLRASLQAAHVQPPAWHINTAEALAQEGKPGHTLIIDLKPGINLSLYEIVEVWGYSDPEWTPIMMHLRGLIVDRPLGELDRDAFVRPRCEITAPTFSLMYLNGGIAQGELTGKWVPPGRSSTNSVLLSAEMFKYFADKANEVLTGLA